MTHSYDSPTSASDTELDSPRDSLPSFPDRVAAPMIHLSTSLDESVGGEGGDLCRNTSNASFFNSVFLDIPDTKQTRPLRVKKRVAPVGPARMRRRSIVSLPRSPRSPSISTHLPLRSPTLLHPTAPPAQLARDNSTASLAHRAITQSFFALSPSHLVPSPSFYPVSSPAESDMHLGLGTDTTLLPGPSPPISPITDPSVRSPSISGLLSPLSPAHTYTCQSKPLPSPPLTPSRAPCKAAKLLGTNPPPIPSHRPLGKGKSIANLLRPTDLPKKAREHYRPLPEAALMDIQRFFGDVPKKYKPPIMSNKVDRGKDTAAAIATRTGYDPTESKRGVEYSNGGREWMDTEEEMEFAWLMSDLTVDMGEGKRGVIKRAAGPEGIKSVLDMPPPSLQAIKGKKEVTTVKMKKEKQGKKVFESFLDLGLDDTTTRANTSVPGLSGRTSSDQTRPFITARTISNPLPPPTRPARPARPSDLDRTLGNRSASSPVKTTSPPSLTQPKNLGPPVRPKHRPPPLDLRLIPPQRDLPIVTSLSPSQFRQSASLQHTNPGEQGRHKYSNSLDSPLIIRISRPIPADMPSSASTGEFEFPQYIRQIDELPINPPRECKTPFKHPRLAPKPAPFAIPLSLASVNPPRGISISTRIGPNHVAQQPREIDLGDIGEKIEMGYGYEYGYGYGYGYGNEGEGVSYFEPIRPTAPVGPGGMAGGVKAGKEWFKRVVRM